MAQKRKAIPKKTRFEVFKRDSFTCQHCGRKAPDVVLQIDHLKPVSKGGTNDILNLVTACEGCNSGKFNRELSDNSVLNKQRRQLEELQERKEQIEMMFEWKKGLLGLDGEVINQLADYWFGLLPGYSLTNDGLQKLKKLRSKFEVDEIMTAMKIAAEQYFEYDADGNPTNESAERAWSKIGGICNNRKRQAEKPHIQRLLYIRGILRKRLSYIKDGEALSLLHKAVKEGADMDDLEIHALSVYNWSQWSDKIEDFINGKGSIP